MTEGLYRMHLEDQKKNEAALEGLMHDMDDVKRRIEKMEDVMENIHSLAASTKQMCEELKEQGERISKLEQEPADKWRSVTNTITTVLVSGAVGYFISFL